jgi:glycosyltransferase involved in cell wall biosynthesis
MKVLNLIQCANLGGMEQASFRLMKAMKPLGVESKLLSLHPVGDLAPLLSDAHIPHEGLKYWGPAGIGIIPALISKLRNSDADRFVMTGPHFAAMGAMRLAGVTGAYLAVHFHHTGVKSPAIWRSIYKLALDRFAWVTFPSDFVRAEALAICPALEDRSLTIRYPQDPSPLVSEEARLQARMRLELSDSDFVVGNAGWLIPRKRFDVFLRVAAAVVKTVPDAVFLIAGGGEEELRLKSLAADLGLSNKVRWLGWLRDMADFQNSLDVLLFNSDWDALGLTPQETVAKGIPLVASVVNGGLAEILDSESGGRVLKQHDVEELARQLITIKNEPEASRESAVRCREHLLRLTDPAMVAHAHLSLLATTPESFRNSAV